MKILFILATCAHLVCFGAAAVPGHVEAWGANFAGEALPPPGNPTDIIAIAAGLSHNLALRENGTVIAWGSNREGQTSVPPGLSNVVAISARLHSVALKADGTVVCWGSSQPSVTNVPPGLNDVVAITAGGWGDGNPFTIALRTNGTVVAWGAVQDDVQVPPGLSNVVQVGAGSFQTLAVKNDGTVVGWGRPNLGNPQTPPPGVSNVAAARGGQTTSFVIKRDGTLFKWGGTFDSNDIPAGVTGIIDVQLGNQHVLALRTNGTVLAWGFDSNGQGSVPPGLSGVTAIGAGANYNIALTARPTIRSITEPLLADVGNKVVLTVDAGGESLRYQWQHFGTNLPTETNATLVIAAATTAHYGSYTVLVTNPHGTNSASTSIAIDLLPPQIGLTPRETTLFRGQTEFIRANVKGAGPFTYQWTKDRQLIEGATTPDLELVVVGQEASGEYRVTVTDAVGGITTSAPAVVVALDPRGQQLRLKPVLDTSIHSAGVNPMGDATLLAGVRRNGTRDRALIRFDLSAVPREANITSSSLRLTVVRESRSPEPSAFQLRRILKPWDASANWFNRQAGLAWSAPGGADGADYLTEGSLAQIGAAELIFANVPSMVSDIRGWVTTPGSNYGWIVLTDESIGGTAHHFASSESGSQPELTLTYATPAAPPHLSARATSGDMQLGIVGAPGWFYEIEAADRLNGQWTPLTNVAAGAALSPIQVRFPLTNAVQFFRARMN